MVSELLLLKHIVSIIDTVVIGYYFHVFCMRYSRHTYLTLLGGQRTAFRNQLFTSTWLIRVSLWLLLVSWPRSFPMTFMSLLPISQWKSSDDWPCFSKWVLGLKLKTSSLCKSAFTWCAISLDTEILFKFSDSF